MDEASCVADRYRRVAGRFSEVAAGVPADGWEAPAPCTGWVARDVVRHLVEWFPPFLRDGAGIELPAGPSVDDDPVQARPAMSDGGQSVLDHPATTPVTFDHPRAGAHPLDEAIGRFFLSDVLIHTWDLARATGQDETLDPDEVHAMLTGIEPYDEALGSSGHYGPKVAVSDD